MDERELIRRSNERARRIADKRGFSSTNDEAAYGWWVAPLPPPSRLSDYAIQRWGAALDVVIVRPEPRWEPNPAISARDLEELGLSRIEARHRIHEWVSDPTPFPDFTVYGGSSEALDE